MWRKITPDSTHTVAGGHRWVKGCLGESTSNDSGSTLSQKKFRLKVALPREECRVPEYDTHQARYYFPALGDILFSSVGRALAL